MSTPTYKLGSDTRSTKFPEATSTGKLILPRVGSSKGKCDVLEKVHHSTMLHDVEQKKIVQSSSFLLSQINIKIDAYIKGLMLELSCRKELSLRSGPWQRCRQNREQSTA